MCLGYKYMSVIDICMEFFKINVSDNQIIVWIITGQHFEFVMGQWLREDYLEITCFLFFMYLNLTLML